MQKRKDFNKDNNKGRSGRSNSSKPGGRRSNSDSRDSSGRDSKPFKKPSLGTSRFKKSDKPTFSKRDGDKPSFEKKERFGSKTSSYSKSSGGKARVSKRYKADGFSSTEGDKSFDKKEFKGGDRRGSKPYEKKEFKDGDRRSSKPYEKKEFKDGDRRSSKPYEKKEFKGNDTFEAKPYVRKEFGDSEKPAYKPKEGKHFSKSHHAHSRYKSKVGSKKEETKIDDGKIRLNRYIASAGICPRREADLLIESGVVKVNGKVVTELGTKVLLTDIVQVDKQTISPEKKVYILLNKPKGYTTTSEDNKEGKSVFSLIKGATRLEVYTVGKMDRNATGVLLITNDIPLAEKLTNPKNGIKKIYQVSTDKVVPKKDLETLKSGIELEDGIIKVDEASYVEGSDDKKEIGIEIRSNRSKVVRRMFEHLGYKVAKLDRVYFAGLTKKKIARGEWRTLNETELNLLKMQA